MRLTTSQNALHFGVKYSKLRWFLGLRPTPRWGAYDAPSNPLVGRGFLPSALAISQTHIYSLGLYAKSSTNFRLPRVHPSRAYSASIFHLQYVPLLEIP